MSYKFFYLYFAGATVALLLLIYQVMTYYPDLNGIGLFINIFPVILLYYMAYKVRREKQDRDMM